QDAIQLYGLSVARLAIFQLAEEQAIAVGDEEIRATVAVEVRDGETEAVNIVRQPNLLGDILELQVALVAEERGARLLREAIFDDEQIEQAVAVVVEDADVAGGEQRLRAGAALLRDIDELALVVAEQV